ncbi:MAG TPA: hypothetical protein VF054_05895 [Micromonosporaceae bacterium]
MTADSPAEAALLDEPTTSDLAAKVHEAWREFAGALADALPALPAGARLGLTLDPTASGTGDAVYGIEVEAEAEGVLRALAVGNASLPDGYRLDRAAIAELVALGWSPPGVVEDSGQQFGLVTRADEARAAAVVMTRTLRDVYGAPHPAFVTYLVEAPDDQQAAVPALGSARPLVASAVDTAPRSAADLADLERLSLADRVHLVLAAMMKTEADAVPVDADGDIGIRAGSAMVFVKVRDNPPLVDVFSPVLTELHPSEALYERLSELTSRMPIGRLYFTGGTVWASVPVFGRDFQASHLMLAVQVMTGLADELDDRLHGEFGGKRFFGEEKPAVRSEGTGMYL